MSSGVEKILIVDDEHINLEFFDVMLSRLGYEVSVASDGDTALERIVQDHPDLVLLDNILPGKTGWEITRLVKQDEAYREIADTSIIMFSAMDEVEDKVEGFELGIEDYITKPFNFSEVLARIQAVLRQRELSRQVNRREKRLALAESLSSSLIYFTRHIKDPIKKLHEAASALDAGDSAAVERFVADVTSEAGSILASIDGLEDEVRELQSQDDQLKAKELSLDALEEKFRKHAAMTIHDVQGK